AMNNAKRVEPDASLIIVELGGNDVFYDTPSEEFAANLDAMLSELARHKVPIALIELPLPPFYNRFGEAQRQLAKKYGAMLVPRRLLARVLASPDATVDSLHLSPAGHERLAQALWEMR
ncbi:MAG: acyl-CoA thioesterase, partial [Candidatus Hydrogenedentes bacterium]|nr:acyl-CoA thioesterase [Candidatus Hydrogenedentota bacterium]